MIRKTKNGWKVISEEGKTTELSKLGSVLVKLSRLSKFKVLQKYKVPLTEDERKEVFKHDAIWSYGCSKDPNTGKKVQKVSAVWKSKNPKTGKVVYVTNTHRAYNTSPTLKGIIRRYHRFINGTA